MPGKPGPDKRGPRPAAGAAGPFRWPGAERQGHARPAWPRLTG